MKKSLLYITLMTVVLVLGSCTRNHGDIGPWFGTWHVEQITADGTPVNLEGDYFFQFQNDIFRVSFVGARDRVVESFGTWSEDDGTMTVTFPDPAVFYILMPGLESHNRFTVTHTPGGTVTFTKTDNEGTLYTYRLKKFP